MTDDDTRSTEKLGGAPRPDQRNPPHRILVVDDEFDLRQLITYNLVQSGYDVDAFENGADAWEALQVNHYDLLITDNYMPKVTGVDLLHRLHGKGMALPVIMATGVLPMEEFARNPWLEPVAILIKPYTLADLLERVKAVMLAIDGAHEQIELFPNCEQQHTASKLHS